MKNTTNYTNTLIEIAPDSKTSEGTVPPVRGEKKSIANLEYEMIAANPYKYTSDEVKFAVHITRNAIPKAQQNAQRSAYFSKGQPCFRASPLTKSYGWGVHFDSQSKMALIAYESEKYKKLQNDKRVEKVFAMRSKRQ